MISRRTLQLTAAALICLTGTAACQISSPAESPSNQHPRTISPQPKTTSIPSSLRDALRFGYSIDRNKDCPMFTTASFADTFPPSTTPGQQLVAEHSTMNSPDSGYLHCEIFALNSADQNDKRLVMDIKMARKDKDVPDENPDRLGLFNDLTKIDVNTITPLPNSHPGFGIESSPLGFRWTCGRYTLAVDPRGHDGVFKDSAEAHKLMRTAFNSSVRELCGTPKIPAFDIRNMPYTLWRNFDAYGGTSPESYGVPRPEDMKPVERRTLTKSPNPGKSPTRSSTPAVTTRPSSTQSTS